MRNSWKANGNRKKKEDRRVVKMRNPLSGQLIKLFLRSHAGFPVKSLCSKHIPFLNLLLTPFQNVDHFSKSKYTTAAIHLDKQCV